jgi:hypothetical protein
MLHGSQIKHEFPQGAKGTDVAGRIPDNPSSAVISAAPRQRQRETDMIMEALVREYLSSALLSN